MGGKGNMGGGGKMLALTISMLSTGRADWCNARVCQTVGLETPGSSGMSQRW
jgi:hypothetical protein